MRRFLLGLVILAAPLAAQTSSAMDAQESRQDIPGRPVDSTVVAAPVIVRGDTVLFVPSATGA